MKKLLLIPLTLGLFILQDPAFAQQQMTFDASTSLILKELQALVIEEDGQIKVRLRLGNDDGKTPHKDRLEQGDLILMINGKRVKDMATLRKIYTDTPEGEEIKVGVRRGEESFIVRGIKGDLPESPSPGNGQMVMSFQVDGDGPPPVFLAELGLVVSDRNGKVVVQNVMDMVAPPEITDLNIEKYHLSEIAGEQPESAEEAKELLAAIEPGAELSLTFTKDGDEKTITIIKPESRSRIVTRNNN